jgi:5-oxoprolinase (ATP-hydrolysing)/N-methylhydantoinase A
VILERPDEVVELSLAGGSGFSEPSERPLAAIAEDLRQGYVGEESANRIYGYAGRRAHVGWAKLHPTSRR